MTTFESLPVREAQLPQGTIRYREVGDGPPIVFVHGLLAAGNLWRKVVPRLARSYRCIVPDWPLGAHTIAMKPDADLSPRGVAAVVAGFLEALDLRDVTLVGNDSGGAISQLVAAFHGERLGRLVLTTCDAFEIFPPPAFAYLGVLAHLPGAFFVLAKAMRAFPALTRLPIAFGRVTKRPIAQPILDGWVTPSASDAGVRRDIGKFMRAVSAKDTMAAARALRDFKKPALIVWTPEDPFFPVTLAERLRDAIPDARLELVPDAHVFIAEDRPEKLGEILEGFVPNLRSRPAAVA